MPTKIAPKSKHETVLNSYLTPHKMGVGGTADSSETGPLIGGTMESSIDVPEKAKLGTVIKLTARKKFPWDIELEKWRYAKGGTIEDITGREKYLCQAVFDNILADCPQKPGYLKVGLVQQKGTTISFYETYELCILLGSNWSEYYTDETRDWLLALGEKIKEKYTQIISVGLMASAGALKFESETHVAKDILAKQESLPPMKLGGTVINSTILFNIDYETKQEVEKAGNDISQRESILKKIVENHGYTLDEYLSSKNPKLMRFKNGGNVDANLTEQQKQKVVCQIVEIAEKCNVTAKVSYNKKGEVDIDVSEFKNTKEYKKFLKQVKQLEGTITFKKGGEITGIPIYRGTWHPQGSSSYPEFEIRNNEIFTTKFNDDYDKKPWYEIKDNKIYATVDNPYYHGNSSFEWFEIKEDEIYATIYNPAAEFGTTSPWFIIDRDKKMKHGGKIEKPETWKISYLNKKKKFAQTDKTFTGQNAYEDAVKWGTKNLPNFNLDMVRRILSKGGQTPKQSEKIAKVMREFKEGKLKTWAGKKVKKPKQAIAIALSEAGVSKKQK